MVFVYIIYANWQVNGHFNLKCIFVVMNFSDKKTVRVAILDLYEGVANQGMRCIREIIDNWSIENNVDIERDEFEVRLLEEMPGLEYDLYISSGGPGSPMDSEGSTWEEKFFNWVQRLADYNNNPDNSQKKYAFFICHSFQLMARQFNIGAVRKRRSTAFGIFPIHMLPEGDNEYLFKGLCDPFYAMDSRDYEVVEPDHVQLAALNATILAIEKERPHVPYERAIMAVRFNNYFIGTQFHPEADSIGMTMYLQREDKKKTIVHNYGLEKWQSMMKQLNDPDKIMWTYNHLLPNFLNLAIHLPTATTTPALRC